MKHSAVNIAPRNCFLLNHGLNQIIARQVTRSCGASSRIFMVAFHVLEVTVEHGGLHQNIVSIGNLE